MIPRRLCTRRGLHGFSLLELGVVLGVISIVVATSLTLGSDAMQGADRVTTQSRLTAVKQALDHYVKLNGHLPCPADRENIPTDAAFGVEQRIANYDGAATTHICAGSTAGNGLVVVEDPPLTPQAYIGAVPTRTLGLPDNYATDAWGNKLTYAVSAPHVGDYRSIATQGTLIVKTGDRTNINSILTMHRFTRSYGGATNNGSGEIQLTPSDMADLANGDLVTIVGNTGGSVSYYGSYSVAGITGTTIDLAGSAFSVLADTDGTISWQKPGAAATYVVVSHGADGRGAFPLNGTAPSHVCYGDGAPPPCDAGSDACNDIENCDDEISIDLPPTDPNALTFYDTLHNDGDIPETYFDDYIVWGTNEATLPAVKTNAYTSCPTGCAAWCAPCTTNYPDETTVPSANRVSLCQKVVNLASVNCTATCYWSGTATDSTFVRCP